MIDLARGPMLATLVDELPVAEPSRRLVFEPKWDGFRALARIDEHGGVNLLSRRGKAMTDAFPDVVEAVFEHIPAATILDGELVRWSTEGRLDFAALQRRHAGGRHARTLARAEPCHYVVFDLLQLRGHDLTAEPLRRRRELLEELFAVMPGPSLLSLGMQTGDTDTARSWLEQLAPTGIEGLVIKRPSEPYRLGVRGWQKIKHYATTEAIVGGVTGSLAKPDNVLLGRPDSTTGDLRLVGRTTTLHAPQAAELAALLTPAAGEHPWPEQLPPSWHSGGQPIDYVRVKPQVVVEVRVDVARIGDRWRHGLRYLRARADLTASDVPLDLELET